MAAFLSILEARICITKKRHFLYISGKIQIQAIPLNNSDYDDFELKLEAIKYFEITPRVSAD